MTAFSSGSDIKVRYSVHYSRASGAACFMMWDSDQMRHTHTIEVVLIGLRKVRIPEVSEVAG